MKLKFKVQPYQTHAVDALADCFAGQPKSSGVSYRIDPGAKPAAPVAPRQVPLAGLEPAFAISDDAGFRNADLVLSAAQLLPVRCAGNNGQMEGDSAANGGARQIDIRMRPRSCWTCFSALAYRGFPVE
jgi:hypothetical protein